MLKREKLQVRDIVGMAFDNASTFSGKKTGVQIRIKKIAPCALFVHCHLARVQAANAANGMKHLQCRTLGALAMGAAPGGPSLAHVHMRQA